MNLIFEDSKYIFTSKEKNAKFMNDMVLNIPIHSVPEEGSKKDPYMEKLFHQKLDESYMDDNTYKNIMSCNYDKNDISDDQLKMDKLFQQKYITTETEKEFEENMKKRSEYEDWRVHELMDCPAVKRLINHTHKTVKVEKEFEENTNKNSEDWQEIICAYPVKKELTNIMPVNKETPAEIIVETPIKAQKEESFNNVSNVATSSSQLYQVEPYQNEKLQTFLAAIGDIPFDKDTKIVVKHRHNGMKEVRQYKFY
jgi:hypothetical protein